MPLSPELQEALDHVRKAGEIVERHMMSPLIADTPGKLHFEVDKRYKAVLGCGVLGRVIRELDPAFADPSGQPFKC